MFHENRIANSHEFFNFNQIEPMKNYNRKIATGSSRFLSFDDFFSTISFYRDFANQTKETEIECDSLQICTVECSTANVNKSDMDIADGYLRWSDLQAISQKGIFYLL